MSKVGTTGSKRVMDIAAATILLLFFTPVFFFLGLLLYCFNDRQIFFFQERPGQHHKIFKIIKFKTMSDKRDAQGKLLPDRERITWWGTWMRSCSLDELPQLFNVLRGDMSLVGPRPLLTEYLSRYNAVQLRRHDVKPGITGWAQVNGRNGISWEEKFDLDVWYVDHCSLTLDLRILWLTVQKVLRRTDVAQKDHVSMEPFKGTV